MKHVVLSDPTEVEQLHQRILASSSKAMLAIQEYSLAESPLEAMGRLKFEKVGADPLNPDRALNFIEQLNQTFTYVVSLFAVKRLLATHPDHAPFELNLGTRGGFDVQSLDGAVVAETFAAVDPRNNSKLDKDVARVRESGARAKYVFFCSDLPQYHEWREGDVTIVPIERTVLLGPQRRSV